MNYQQTKQFLKERIAYYEEAEIAYLDYEYAHKFTLDELQYMYEQNEIRLSICQGELLFTEAKHLLGLI